MMSLSSHVLIAGLAFALASSACAGGAAPAERAPSASPPAPSTSASPSSPTVTAPGGRESCRAVAEDFAAAVNQNDGAAWRALYPPLERVDAAVTCTGKNPFVSFVRDELAQDEAWDLSTRSPDGDHRFDAAGSTVESSHVAATGELAVEGCAAREALRIENLAARFRFGDSTSSGVRRFTCVGLADGWYAVRID